MNPNPNKDVTAQLDEFKNKYKSKKPSFFESKATNKMERAKEITTQIPLDQLLSNTFFIIDNSNKIYLDYPKLKLFATPNIYDQMLEHVTKLIQICVNIFGNVELHANLNTFSITAANRYKELIQKLCTHFFQSDSLYKNEITHIYLHNYPKIIPLLTSLFSGFVDDNSYDKIVLVQ
jgi:hypothetical protein